MSGEYVFWVIITPAWTAGWMITSAYFTRRWYSNQYCDTESNCTYKYGGPYGADSGRHGETCRKWGNHPMQPADAMWPAVIWPITLWYQILCRIHTHEPKRTKRKILTDAELKRLDDILYQTEEKEVA